MIRAVRNVCSSDHYQPHTMKPKHVFWATLFISLGVCATWPIRNEVAIYNQGLPSAAVIDLKDFSGRIFPSEKVHPGTFSITVPFSEIKGPDAIISYTLELDRSFPWPAHIAKIDGWMPDNKTPGVFQKATAAHSALSFWNSSYVDVDEITFKNGQILIIPVKNPDCLIIVIICIVFLSLIFSLSVALVAHIIRRVANRSKAMGR